MPLQALPAWVTLLVTLRVPEGPQCWQKHLELCSCRRGLQELTSPGGGAHGDLEWVSVAESSRVLGAECSSLGRGQGSGSIQGGTGKCGTRDCSDVSLLVPVPVSSPRGLGSPWPCQQCLPSEGWRSGAVLPRQGTGSYPRGYPSGGVRGATPTPAHSGGTPRLLT